MDRDTINKVLMSYIETERDLISFVKEILHDSFKDNKSFLNYALAELEDWYESPESFGLSLECMKNNHKNALEKTAKWRAEQEIKGQSNE
jgi:hypothetical protein